MEKNSQGVMVLKDINGREYALTKVFEKPDLNGIIKKGVVIEAEGKKWVLKSDAPAIQATEEVLKSITATGGVAQSLETQDLEGKKKKDDEEDIKKSAVILKSARTQKGAEDHLRMLKSRFPEALVVKSLHGYDEVYATDGCVGMPAPAMHTVIIEQDLQPAIKAAKAGEVKELLKALLDEGLFEVSSYDAVPRPSEKLNEMIIELMKDTFKSLPESTTQEEADNKQTGKEEAISDAKVQSAIHDRDVQPSNSTPSGVSGGEVISDGKVGTSFTSRGAQPAQGEAPKLALTQQEADNKDGDLTAIKKSEQFFVHLHEAKRFVTKNIDYDYRPTTPDERSKVGRAKAYVAYPKKK